MPYKSAKDTRQKGFGFQVNILAIEFLLFGQEKSLQTGEFANGESANGESGLSFAIRSFAIPVYSG